MLVIKGQFTVATGGAPVGFTLDAQTIIPAENCVWLQETWDDTAKKYTIGEAHYIFNDTAYEVDGAELGFLNKSGSFNKIA